MANIVQFKRSSVPGRVPDAANVEVGEPVVNLADQIIFTKDGSGTVKVIGAGTTSNVTEGTNLYFTNARAVSALTAGSGISLSANGLLTASVELVETGGFINSTLSTFPGASSNFDYGAGESGFSESRDAFGVSLVATYDCMEPIGSLITNIDFEALA